jgi:hypothetical protein
MSSSPIDIVKVFYGTFSLMGADKAGLYLADDFTLTGFAPAPMDKTAWLSFLSALKHALPDLKIRLTDVKVSGDGVSGDGVPRHSVHFTEMGVGTHRFPLALESLGLPDVPASGKSVALPESKWVLTVTGSRITRAELPVPLSPGTGLPGMLAALGALPAPAS